jgi:predicted kinase
MKVYILRGISGSGKSTWARGNCRQAWIVSADSHFTHEGKYKFNPAELPKAHAHCLQNFIDHCLKHWGDVIVDNTNCTIAEVAPYVAIAQAYGHEVEVHEFRALVGTAAAENVHSVPEDTIGRMANALSASMAYYPPYWPQPIIHTR